MAGTPKNAQLLSINEFEKDLISSLNKEAEARIAYNLGHDDAPINVKHWISTGSRLLDYTISNRSHGGVPGGRIIEIYGPPSIGKSHLGYQLIRNVQKMGGVGIYIDTENATSIENLASLGVNVSKRFVFIDESCTERIFAIIQATVEKARALSDDVPVLVVWDSVAASSPKAEIEADYDKETIGLLARAMSRGLRKLVHVLTDNGVTLVCLNQTRTKIGVMYGDPTTVPGGIALTFYATTRIALTGGSSIKNGDGDVIGIEVHAMTQKNKIAPPRRKATFEIHFGRGIRESEQIFDRCFQHGVVEDADGNKISASGSGTWKTFEVVNKDGEVLFTKKFNKSKFGEILDDKEIAPYVDTLLDGVLIKEFAQDAVPFGNDEEGADATASEAPIE